MPFEFKDQHDSTCTSRSRSSPTRSTDFAKGKRGSRVRAVSAHKFIRSIYFRDPNGYVIELAAKVRGKEKRDGSHKKTMLATC